MMKRYMALILVLSLFIVAAFTGCFENGENKKETFSGDYDANQNTILKITNLNGDITINEWDGDTVKMTGEKIVPEKYKDELDEVEVNVTEANNEIIIRTIYQDDDERHVTVNMEIDVPSYVYIEFVKNTNGNIEISDTYGNTSVENTNGNVIINDVEGFVSVENTNGNNEVRGTTGIGDVGTTNGNVLVEISDISENVSIISTNGNVDVYILLTLNATIDMQTTNGALTISEVTLDKSLDDDTHVIGNLNDGGYKINIQTSNGNAKLYKLNA
jgi:hypothetical protein